MIMRSFVVTAFALSVAGFLAAAPANAATWQCQGGELACGSSAKASKSYKSKSAYTSSKATYRKASRKAKTHSRHAVRTSSRKVRHAARRPVHSGSHAMSGVASYYWQPQPVASGGRFNPNALTAAHKTLPFGTKVRVTHLGNGRSVTVTINDRGPYIRGRIIDLSRRAAGVIGMTGSGVARVAVSVVGRS
jgi:rare lipoprotein A